METKFLENAYTSDGTDGLIAGTLAVKRGDVKSHRTFYSWERPRMKTFRERREAIGYATRPALAKDMGTNPNTIKSWETGHRPVPKWALLWLQRAEFAYSKRTHKSKMRVARCLRKLKTKSILAA